MYDLFLMHEVHCKQQLSDYGHGVKLIVKFPLGQLRQEIAAFLELQKKLDVVLGFVNFEQL